MLGLATETDYRVWVIGLAEVKRWPDGRVLEWSRTGFLSFTVMKTLATTVWSWKMFVCL